MIIIKSFKNIIIASFLICTFLITLTSCGTHKEPQNTTTATPTVRITFPEGYTVIQISELLEENGVCSAADFQEACKTVPESYATLVGDIDEMHIFALEGYIFPDTYEFYVGEGAQNALSRFLSNTKNKITQKYFDRAEELGLTMNEVFTLASVIQSEASVTSEMANVSSVFHNRLAKQASGFPYLGSDVTRHYIEKKMAEYIETNQLDYDALFEAYCTNDGYSLKTQGLPSGPICNPGISAVNAALWPSDTDYLYFFTDKDNNFHYNKSLSAHQSEYYAAYN